MGAAAPKAKPPEIVAAPGAPITDDDARKAFTVLEDIRLRDGGITAEAVITAAKNPDSSIHKHFTWNDTEAARKQRLHEARQLLLRIHEVIHSPTKGAIRTRRYESVRVDTGQYSGRIYLDAPTVHSSADYSSQIIERAIGEYERCKAKYERFQELALIHQAIDTTSARVRRKRPKGGRRKKK